MQQADLIWGLVGFFVTLMVFSYILGDNPFFRLVTYLFIGVAAGYVFLTLLEQVMWPKLVLPLFNGSLISVIPLILGLFLLTKLFPRFNRLGDIPMAYLVGAGASITMGGLMVGSLIPQVMATINLFDLSLAAKNEVPPAVQMIDGIIILVGSLTTLMYFYFSTRAKPDQPSNNRGPVIEILAKIGQVFIGITLGALFAGVYSAALTALIERVSFVWNFILNFLHPILG
jgi:hypothetical protein